MENARTKIPPSKRIAYIAVMCALLIAAQYVFSFVVGVEIVTVLLVCFASVCGVRSGVICAVAFSLLRCLVYGFSPAAVILYLIYYPLLAAVSGGLGHIKDETFKSCPAALVICVNLLLCILMAACALVYGFDVIKVSKLWQTTAYVLIWVIFGLCFAELVAFNALAAANRVFTRTQCGIRGFHTHADCGKRKNDSLSPQSVKARSLICLVLSSYSLESQHSI